MLPTVGDGVPAAVVPAIVVPDAEVPVIVVPVAVVPVYVVPVAVTAVLPAIVVRIENGDAVATVGAAVTGDPVVQAVQPVMVNSDVPKYVP